MALQKIKTADREEWKALRGKYIGGSDAAAVVGLNPFSSPYSVWAEKTGKVPPFEGNLATEVGTFLEEFVAQKFAQETGKKVRRCNLSMINDAYPWAIANIDRDIVGEDAGLEIKTTGELTMKRFKTGDYPSQYYVQCMHYMAVTGKAKWYLAILSGNKDFHIYEIARDQEEIDALMAAEQELYRHIKDNTPPPADGSMATTKAIKTIYKDSDGSTVDLFGFDAQLDTYMALNKRIKELETERDEIANTIKLAMGSAEKGESSRYKISWANRSVHSFDTKAFKAANPNIDLDPYYKSGASRPFVPREKK